LDRKSSADVTPCCTTKAVGDSNDGCTGWQRLKSTRILARKADLYVQRPYHGCAYNVDSGTKNQIRADHEAPPFIGH
jgi:hypothetical protein